MMLAIVGDSASGKTTLTRGLSRVLGDEAVTHVCTDDYHRYDRRQRAQLGITPLDPACNYLDILEQDLRSLRSARPILKPTYRHADGTFGPPLYVRPARFVVIEGLLGFHSAELRSTFDCKVFLDPPEDLRRQWKVIRDTTRRGYTTDQVLAELDRREADSARWIRPQRESADIVVSFRPTPHAPADASHLDAVLVLRPTLPHPDLGGLVGPGRDDIQLEGEHGAEQVLRVPGALASERAAEIEEAIWERLHFARHLRSDRLGEFTRGTELLRAEPLAITQLLVLYHVVSARAAIALGASDPEPVAHLA
jgi:phosphoribulokinase